MDLSTSIDAAYAEPESTEATARQIEARIIAAGGRPLLRQYGKPVDATAIKQNLTLASQINRRDPKLASYLGVQSGYAQRVELEQAQRKAAADALQAATAALKERNDTNAAKHRLTLDSAYSDPCTEAKQATRLTNWSCSSSQHCKTPTALPALCESVNAF